MEKIFRSLMVTFLALLVTSCITTNTSRYKISSKRESVSANKKADEITGAIAKKHHFSGNSELINNRNTYQFPTRSRSDLETKPLWLSYAVEKSSNSASIELTEWHVIKEGDLKKEIRIDLENHLKLLNNYFIVEKEGWFRWVPLK